MARGSIKRFGYGKKSLEKRKTAMVKSLDKSRISWFQTNLEDMFLAKVRLVSVYAQCPALLMLIFDQIEVTSTQSSTLCADLRETYM